MTLRRFSLTAGLGAVLVAAGCNNDGLNIPPPPAYTGGAMFQRYVSIGNSITAGFQSGGINDSTQRQAYPVLVAAAMGGDPFYYPSLNLPGCPPPYTNIFTGARLGVGSTATTCLFRAPTPPYVSNVAVPSALVFDIQHNGPGPFTNSNALTQLILGGRTQYQAALAARPTFVSIWIGNNDVLGSVLSPTNAGDSTLITRVDTFQTRYQKMVDSLKDNRVDRGILIGVANVTAIPYLSQGQAYLAAKLAGALPANFTVGANCAPSGSGGKGDSVLVPFPFGGFLIATAAGGTPTTLSCTEPQTVQPAELRKIVSTVNQYNSFLIALAAQHAWAYLDPNPTLDSLRLIPTEVRPFPNFNTPCSTSPFGLAFSCDGFHPSGSTHRLIAQHLVRAINSSYISAIPAVP